MNRLTQKSTQLGLRKKRIRTVVSGSTARPRLSVHISHRHVSAQIIDDSRRHTLAAATTVGSKQTNAVSMTEQAVQIGTAIAKKAKSAKVNKVVLDRGGRLYHGRVKALAEAARAQGLEF